VSALRKINLLTVVLVAIAIASFVAKLKLGYGFYEGR
jgi:hypothetical protein